MINDLNDLYRFIIKYYEDSYNDLSLSDDAIPAGLPLVLKDYYKNLGFLTTIKASQENRFKAPLNAQDCLLSIDRLEEDDGFLTIAWENQGNWSCQVKVNEDDPNVYSDALECIGEGIGFEDIEYPLSKFLITLSLQETVMSANYLYTASCEGEINDILVDPVHDLWLNGRTAYNEDTHHFYCNSDESIILMQYQGNWLASKNEIPQTAVKTEINHLS